MALSGIEIYKLLPRTNCRDCGYPTCLAFAMKVAAHQADPSDCPHLSPEAVQALIEAAAPPVARVEIGGGPEPFVIGEETELFRHQKTFFHPPGIFPVAGDDDPASLEQTAKIAAEVSFDRVGEQLKFQGVAVEHRAGSAADFADACREMADLYSGPLVLVCREAEALITAARAVDDRRPVLIGADEGNLDSLLPVAAEISSTLALMADNLDDLLKLSESAASQGGKNLLLYPNNDSPRSWFTNATALRRLAINSKYRPAGHPIVLRTSAPGTAGVLAAGLGIAKYAGIILWDHPSVPGALALFTLRQNIYTDPQRPMRVEEGIYPIRNPDENSPLMVTTNFSLTYFLVSGEVENSGVPSHLAIMDADGLSVLTAWAAGKFVADRIAAFLKKSGALDKVSHREVIIPGYVSSISGELEEALGNGRVIVGPREATGLPDFLKKYRPGG